MKVISQARSYAGTQFVYEFASSELKTPTRIGLYVPDTASVQDTAAPALVWLSGLTCTEDNFVTKAGAQRVAAELGLVIIAPDTSPRGEDVPDDPDGAWDFGLGAGFYVDATQAPWSTHYRMRAYVEQELLDAVSSVTSIDRNRVGIFGHSMGGHGALTIGMRNPQTFKSISAFAPICAPLQCPWGDKALSNYLGDDRASWREYDACALLEDGARPDALLVDQGASDNFLEEQLKPELLQVACAAAGVNLDLRHQTGFDHSYFFIASFMEEHLRWHDARLRSAHG